MRALFGGDKHCELSSQEKTDFLGGVSERFVLNIKCVMVLNICIIFHCLLVVGVMHFIQKYSLQRPLYFVNHFFNFIYAVFPGLHFT